MRAVLGILVAAAAATPALAQTLPPPMTFRAVGWCDEPQRLGQPPVRLLALCPIERVRYAIFAEGMIVRDTPNALKHFLAMPRDGRLGPDTELYLHSGGGDVLGGIELGRAIRAAHLSTNVGVLRQAGAQGTASPPIVGAGYCISACTLSFLGGTERYFGAGIFGVHRFYKPPPKPGEPPRPADPYAMDEAQLLTGQILAYVREMGVDAGFVNEMVKTGRERGQPAEAHQNFSRMSPARMVELNVVTASATRWEALVDPKTRNWAVRGEWVRPSAVRTFEFVCDTAAPGGRDVALRARATVAGLHKTPATLASSTVLVTISHDGSPSTNTAEFARDRLVAAPRVSEGVVELELRLGPALASALQTATRVTVGFQMPTPPRATDIGRPGFENYTLDVDVAAKGRDLLRTLVANCR